MCTNKYHSIKSTKYKKNNKRKIYVCLYKRNIIKLKRIYNYLYFYKQLATYVHI